MMWWWSSQSSQLAHLSTHSTKVSPITSGVVRNNPISKITRSTVKIKMYRGTEVGRRFSQIRSPGFVAKLTFHWLDFREALNEDCLGALKPDRNNRW